MKNRIRTFGEKRIFKLPIFFCINAESSPPSPSQAKFAEYTLTVHNGRIYPLPELLSASI
jgi:hypothetical protein